MWQYNYDYLAHHGILGQKWGVRRFQNQDGSLTKEGRERYSKYKVVKKGSKVYRAISGNSLDFMNRPYTYVNITEDYSSHNINTSSGFSGRYKNDVEMVTTKPLKIATLNEYLNSANDIFKLNVNHIKNLPHEYREGEYSINANNRYFEKIIKDLMKKGYDGVHDPIDYQSHLRKDSEEDAIAAIIFNPKNKLDIARTYSR